MKLILTNQTLNTLCHCLDYGYTANSREEYRDGIAQERREHIEEFRKQLVKQIPDGQKKIMILFDDSHTINKTKIKQTLPANTQKTITQLIQKKWIIENENETYTLTYLGRKFLSQILNRQPNHLYR